MPVNDYKSYEVQAPTLHDMQHSIRCVHCGAILCVHDRVMNDFHIDVRDTFPHRAGCPLVASNPPTPPVPPEPTATYPPGYAELHARLLALDIRVSKLEGHLDGLEERPT